MEMLRENLSQINKTKGKIRELKKILKDQRQLVEDQIKCYDVVLKIGENNLGYDENMKENKKSPYFFDFESGNFHIMPEDKALLKSCSDAIETKLENLYRELKENADKLEKLGCTYKKVIGASKKYTNIYKCIRVIIDHERKYELMLFRMALDENEKTISCELQSVQYEYYKGEVYSCDIYPQSLENPQQELGGEENGYYNPNVSFGDTEKTIIGNFIDFIEQKETEYKKM